MSHVLLTWVKKFTFHFTFRTVQRKAAMSDSNKTFYTCILRKSYTVYQGFQKTE